MTSDEIKIGISRLEKIFNLGLQIDEELRMEYLEAFRYVDSAVFRDAVQLVVETFKPFPLEPFPSISTIAGAVMETSERNLERAGWDARGEPPPDTARADYCQRCGNLGLYLAETGQARFCGCERGRMKRASWNVQSGARKREESVSRAIEKMPPAAAPVRGLHEWNPLGFWEDTADEHKRWMARRRRELIEQNARAARRERRLDAQKKIFPPEGMKRLMEERIGQIEALRRDADREPGEDEEEPPF